MVRQIAGRDLEAAQLGEILGEVAERVFRPADGFERVLVWGRRWEAQRLGRPRRDGAGDGGGARLDREGEQLGRQPLALPKSRDATRSAGPDRERLVAGSRASAARRASGPPGSRAPCGVRRTGSLAVAGRSDRRARRRRSSPGRVGVPGGFTLDELPLAVRLERGHRGLVESDYPGRALRLAREDRRAAADRHHLLLDP